MTNPVTKFRNDMFGSRGMDIQEALNYCETLINTLGQGDQVGIRVGLGVLLNTIEKAVTQSQGPSPEKIAIIALIDERIAEHKLVREDAIGDAVDEHIRNLDDKIEDWMSHNFDIENYNVGDAIESWADRNLEDKINEAINNLTFTVNVE
jgi:hypothetical protein